ncbi:TetR/AcrR family transcriptional regulator [Actinomadura terrae]|uniref:TetR/AcrR family transcriptional regulator n=1 Tax=Actinomadura terrae TaxID=604353 RepID=UPI001FA70459|nr:TetR/AcrR family transcriptional regulator [Actinomadura terrae]
MATGRPREFDVDERLDRALTVFWRQGYEGTALSDLTRAMGINRPSLYAAYGNKETLFRKALDRYVEGPASYVHTALTKPTAHAVAEALLFGAVEVVTRGPGGCLIVQAALATGEQNNAVREEIASRRRAGECDLAARFERARAEGDLPPNIDCDALARYVWSISYGVSVQAAGGASRDDLRKVVELALALWPEQGAPDAGRPAAGQPTASASAR